MRRVEWPPAADEIVRTRYPHERTEVIAADLGMSKDQVAKRAGKLGVKKSAEFISAVGREARKRGWSTKKKEQGADEWAWFYNVRRPSWLMPRLPRSASNKTKEKKHEE